MSHTRYIQTRDGLPHRCRAAPLPGNRGHVRRPDHGKSICWLRALVFYLAKRQQDRSPWVELDLTRAFNSKGFSLSAGRWLWRWLKVDPLFRRYIKVRYVQQVGLRNGWFVIIVAWRPKLAWDQEPLFYGRDRETPRHVRAELRDEDIEASDPVKRHGDCPITRNSHTRFFLPKGQPKNNTPTGTDNQPTLRVAGSSGELPNSKALECRLSVALHRTDSEAPKRLGKTLCRKCAIVVRQLESDFFTNGRFAWPEAHAWNFSAWALVNGFDDLRIRQAWRMAVEQTVADVADGVARIPPALLVTHGRRILGELDPRHREQRIREFYARPKTNRPIQPTDDSPLAAAKAAVEVAPTPKRTSKKHID